MPNQADIGVSMAGSIRHRGPDDSGVWTSPCGEATFAHRRLSILDLSPLGHQPMESADGKFVTVFNGEIYNFSELRRELQTLGHSFRGTSDTEILLASVQEWGLEKALKRFVGMFAFAIWDSTNRTLMLARDRLGEKPLYYGWVGSAFAFSSELKALKFLPEWQGSIDRNSLSMFLAWGCIPGAHSIYSNIRKLPPGTLLRIDRTVPIGAFPQPEEYWSARNAAVSGIERPFRGSDVEATDELERLLKRSVAGQMIADVPVGAFLSGGVDSSAIVAAMQAQSSRPVRTFTIGFHEREFDEAQHASAVARHLGTEHTELYITPVEALAVIPRLPEIYDEPFSDSSQIPTFLVSELARRHVAISLSGDGGDEVFGGYPRYELSQRLWSKVGRLPHPLRVVIARALHAVPREFWNVCFDWIFTLIGRSHWRGLLGDRVPKAADLLDLPTEMALYKSAMLHWKNSEQMVRGARPGLVDEAVAGRQLGAGTFLDKMCYWDMVSYLPDDILVKVDRASMAVSLESRVPLLDHRLVEFAWSLPNRFKFRDGKAKWLLRQVLYRKVPPELIERPKMGFGVPIDQWLRGPLRDWAEELLSESRLKQEGFFDPAPIRQKWEEHVSGKRRWHYYLWDILMFQAWLENQAKPVPLSV